MDLTGRYQVTTSFTSHETDCVGLALFDGTSEITVTQQGSSFTAQINSSTTGIEPAGDDVLRGTINGSQVSYQFSGTLRHNLAGLINGSMTASGTITDPSNFTVTGEGTYQLQTFQCQITFTYTETWTRQ
jgi:hypothetical protein